MLLTKNELQKQIVEGELIVRPLLDQDQIGEISIDFRLGLDFLVSVQGRHSFLNASLNEPSLSIRNHFQFTRRQLGETFLLHPGQTTLSTSIEYIKLPENIFMDLNMRSSYSRLGITISTIVQPGYCGCIPLELTNNNNMAINLTVGARIFQARFLTLQHGSNYFEANRKYKCQVRPEVSRATFDSDLEKLNKLWKSANNIQI